MVYSAPSASSSQTWGCVCKSGWVAAGNGCVLSADLTEIQRTYFSQSQAAQVNYYSVVTPQGNTALVSSSDTFNYYYYHAAVGCALEQDPTEC
jgi:hypothetical protein